MKSIWKTLLELFEVMPRGAGRFYVLYAVLTSLLAILDILALALILTVASSFSNDTPIKVPFLGVLSRNSMGLLILVICALFILKSLSAVLLYWWATRRFASYELEVGDKLFKIYCHSNWEDRKRLSTAEVTRKIDLSMAVTNSGFILQLAQVPGLFITFIAVLLVLVIAQPVTAITAIAYLLAVFTLLFIVIFRRIKLAGKTDRDFSFRTATLISEMVDALKELTLRGKLFEIGALISEKRRISTLARANITFASIVSKYLFEAALIGGFVVIGGIAFFIGGAANAITAITLFAATGFRMMPALYGIQTSLASAAANQIHARDVIDELKDSDGPREVSEIVDSNHFPANPSKIQIRNLSFRYKDSDKEVLSNLNFDFGIGTSLAIVGPSGSGKSTLIDLLLGLSLPTNGTILLDEVPITTFLSQWRSKVGYVPQNVALFDGTIAQNIALTWREDFDKVKVRKTLEGAHLQAFLEDDWFTSVRIGERGDSISGGQKQRLGIARSLYSDPLIIVMDEATSALDTGTENRIVESMKELRGKVTFITVAHRLATIRNYDQICYMEGGKILGMGTFDEVVRSVPQFKDQSKLAGLI